MEDNVVRVETLYTYEAAVRRYERERHHAWLCSQARLKEIRLEQQERRRYFCNQKLYGMIMSLVALLLTLITGNLVCAVLAAPGIVLMITQKMLIVNEYWWTHRDSEE